MNLNELQPGALKEVRFRVGRGQGSGNGKTAGKGHKGQNSRTGGGVRPGFEGGQMRLIQRVPKRGFTNIFADVYTEVNISLLNKFDDGTEVTPELLKQTRVISKIEKDGVKILGNGELSKKLTVKAAKFTEGAKNKIEAAGGKVEVI